jgi:hypothetical protein
MDKNGEGQYSVVNSRDGQIWLAKPVKEDKDTSWRGIISDRVLEVHKTLNFVVQAIFRGAIASP